VPTSLPLSHTSAAIPSHASSSLFARLAGVLRAPRATFAAVAGTPRWAGALAATVAVIFVCSAALLETEVGRLALMDQWERTAIAFGQPVDDARYATFARASENGAFYAVLIALASGPLLVFGVSALLFAAFNGGRRGPASFQQVLAVTAHAGVVLALRQLLAAPLNYSRETLASPTTLSLFFPMLDEASPFARFFAAIDLFVIWWAAVLAVGIAVIYRRRTRPLVFAFIGVYLALAAVLAILMALAGGTA
jgi:hypothetical protein